MEFIKYLLLSSVLLNMYYVYEYLEYIPFKYAISETGYELPYLRGDINDNYRGKRKQIHRQRLLLTRMTRDNNFA
jgi:hypothetical protein